MTPHACSRTGALSSAVHTSQEILTLRHKLKVPWITACSLPTEVVECRPSSRRQRHPTIEDIREAVRVFVDTTALRCPDIELAVSLSERTTPTPTRIGAATRINTHPKSLKERHELPGTILLSNLLQLLHPLGGGALQVVVQVSGRIHDILVRVRRLRLAGFGVAGKAAG